MSDTAPQAGSASLAAMLLAAMKRLGMSALPFVVTVEPCKTSALKRALASLRAMSLPALSPLEVLYISFF